MGNIENFGNHLKELGLSPHTIRNYMGDVQKAIDEEIIDINFLDIHIEYINLLEISRPSKHRLLASLKKYAKFLVQSGIISSVPSIISTLSLPKISQTIPRVTSPDQVYKLINSISNLQIKLILSLLVSTGCRVSSLVNIQIEDINFEKDIITFQMAKGNKPYLTILSEQAKQLVREFIGEKTSGYLFAKSDGTHLSESAIRMFLKKELKENYINPHSIRYGICTSLMAQGIDIYTLSLYMNHSSVKITERYIKLSPESISERFDIIRSSDSVNPQGQDLEKCTLNK
jgi:site-specific recombinase XerD